MRNLTLPEFLSLRDRDRRLARLTHDIALPVARGLEFGASNNPTPLPLGAHVEFVDHAADAGDDNSDAVHVDHVWTGCGAIPIAAEPAYDFAIASQVAQYVPNLLGWLRGIFTVLRPGGVLNLSLPDRRFMFDIKRKVSTLGELLEAYYLDFSRPSLRQVVDHTYGATLVDPARLWNEDVSRNDLPPLCGEYALALAHDQGRRNLEENSYVLCHCWVFTPTSFLDLLEDITRLGLFPFVISQFAPTEPGACEFFACLRRDADVDPAQLLAKQLGAISHVRGLALRNRRIAQRLAEA